MKLSIPKKLIILASLILAGNGIIGFSVFESRKQLMESEQWLQHTEEVISKSGDILSTGKDIESAARGFIITNDSSFLEPLFMAEKTIFLNIGQLSQLIQDNPIQQQRLDSINFYMHQRLNFSTQLVDLRSQQGLDTAIVYASTNQGKTFSDHVRRITTALQLDEAALLKQRKQTKENSDVTYNLTFGMIYLIMLGITIALLISTSNNLHQKEKKEKRAAELNLANKKLDFQNKENEKQEEANKELEAFSYSVSHDLRAPLRHIGGFVDLLIKNNSSQLDETGLRYLNIISESSHEMGNLIDALLTFSRLSRTGLLRTRIDTNSLIRKGFKTFANEMAGRNIKLNLAELPETLGDENLINQVWLNLISNAIKYSRNVEKTIIDIGFKLGKDQTTFYIKDNGAGFDMKYADKLFGVFQRLHKARDYEGIGIGLANVNRIVIRHGGKCWAESEVNQGATFFFSLANK